MRDFLEILCVILLVSFIVVLFFLFDGSPDVYDMLRQSVLDKTCLMKP